MKALSSNGGITEKEVYISRPVGLRSADFPMDDQDKKTLWEMSDDGNSREGLDSGDKSGVIEYLVPKYKEDEVITITKKLSDPLDISKYEELGTNGQSVFSSASYYYGRTAKWMQDENRIGRSWAANEEGTDCCEEGGGGDVPEGFSTKCVAFCEGGETTYGLILFKDGCEDSSGEGSGEGGGGGAPAQIDSGPELPRLVDYIPL
jgi:hypothetical protein